MSVFVLSKISLTTRRAAVVVPVVHRERGAAEAHLWGYDDAPTFPVDPPGRLVMRLPPILEKERG